MTRNSSERGQAEVWIGTSGFVYPHWRRGVFYPQALPHAQELQFFATQFSSVELNNPFYRLPAPETFTNWRRRTPADFLFAMKASRYITHIKRLNDAAEPLKVLLDRARGLGAKLGPVLFQLPPHWHVDVNRLRGFLKILPKRREFVFEFRDPTWLTDSVYSLLHDHNAGLCLAVRQTMTPPDQVVTAGFAYIRMHAGTGRSGNFTDAELNSWAERIKKLQSAGTKTYIYFNNDQQGFAVRDARQLMRLLGIDR